MSESTTRKMDLLLAVYIFCIAAAEFAGAKTFPLGSVFGFQLNASVAIFLIPVIFTINDVVTEVFGRERTRSFIRSAIVVIFMLMMFSLLATSLPPSTRFAGSEAAFDEIFGKSARFAAASLIAFACAELLDVHVFVKVRQRLGQQRLWLRNNLSNFIAQGFDTAIFITLAFYAIGTSPSENAAFLVGIAVPYWLIKCAMSVIETPLVYLGVAWLREQPLQVPAVEPELPAGERA